MKRTRSTSSEKPKPCKRPSSSREDDAAATLRESGSAEPTTRDLFATLPRELVTHIVELGCSSPSTTCSSSAADASTISAGYRPGPRLDITTTLNLTLVSHSFYDLVVPRLFRNVWLSRPSALERFLSVLEARPHAADLVKSLYVGPEDALPNNYYPTESSYDDDLDCSNATDDDEWDRSRISTSLRTPQEAALLPRWCAPDRKWRLHAASKSAPGQAVFDALLAAQHFIDVYPPGAFKEGEDREVTSLKYGNRLWELQAAFDLYLIEMRRYEDEQGITDALSVSEDLLNYPELVLTGYPDRSDCGEDTEEEEKEDESAKEEDNEDNNIQGEDRAEDQKQEEEDNVDSKASAPFTLSRAQLLQHIARPGSTTDRFDHPLLLVRSGVEHDRYYSTKQLEQRAARLFSPWGASSDPLLPRTASFSSILGLLSSVLARAANIENLVLTGFLDLAIYSCNPSPPLLPNLKSLSVGPRRTGNLGRWSLHPFTSLQELRLCNVDVDDEVDLTNPVTQLPRLQHLHMSMVDMSVQYHLRHWFAAIGTYMGPSHAFDAELAARRGLHADDEDDASDRGGSSSISNSNSKSHGSIDSLDDINEPQDSALPLIEAEMGDWARQRIFEGAPSAAVREAWSKGHALPDQSRRVLITKPAKYPGWSGSSDALTVMYAEAREWWEEHCVRKSSARLG